MNIQKRNNFSSVSEVVLNNLNMTEQEFEESKIKEYRIKNLPEAAKRVKQAMTDHQEIWFITDYDVDGIMSAGISDIGLKSLGCTPHIRIPKRFSEGYGLNKKIIEEICEKSGNKKVLIVTIDNGIAAHESILFAKEKGYDVIVIDHHLLSEDNVLPDADIIVDPHIINDEGDFKDYCGAGLAYKLMIELGVDEKTLKICLGFAAIATVADVVPLKYDNWNIVKKGLKTLTSYSGRTIGLYMLMKECNVDKHINEYDIGFKIAPALNAPGRLIDDGATLSFNLITNTSMTGTEALIKTQEILNLNAERKELTHTFLEKIKSKIPTEKQHTPLVLFEKDMPEGIVGIVAGKISDTYKVPCFLMTNLEDGNLKGSSRSYGDFNIKLSMDRCSDLFVKYGGHPGAAGFTIPAANFEKMNKYYSQYNEFNQKEEPTYYDLEISPYRIEQTFTELQKYAPYGNGNPKPVFLVQNFCTYPSGGSNYIYLSENKTVKLYGRDIDAIAFNMAKTFDDLGKPNELNLVATIMENNYKKSSLQLMVADMEKSVSIRKKSILELKLEEKAKLRKK